MKETKGSKKLVLKKETIAQLEETQMIEVNGGREEKKERICGGPYSQLID